MKQEILEKAAEEWIKGFGGLSNSKQSFIEGAKWQSQIMYSEEELKKAIEFGYQLRNNNKPINSGIDWVKEFNSLNK